MIFKFKMIKLSKVRVFHKHLLIVYFEYFFILFFMHLRYFIQITFLLAMKEAFITALMLFQCTKVSNRVNFNF